MFLTEYSNMKKRIPSHLASFYQYTYNAFFTANSVLLLHLACWRVAINDGETRHGGRGFAVLASFQSLFRQRFITHIAAHPKLARPVLHLGTDAVDQNKVDTLAVLNAVC